jgi:hypothetical protein
MSNLESSDLEFKIPTVLVPGYRLIDTCDRFEFEVALWRVYPAHIERPFTIKHINTHRVNQTNTNAMDRRGDLDAIEAELLRRNEEIEAIGAGAAQAAEEALHNQV